MPEKYFVPIADLRQHIDPFGSQTWPCGEITCLEIDTAVKFGMQELTPWNEFRKKILNNSRVREQFAKAGSERPFHINRIAYFVVNGIPFDEVHTIMLSVDEKSVRLHEGRHRMAAAFIRADEKLPALIAGKAESILALLPGAMPVTTDPMKSFMTNASRLRRELI